MNPTERYRNGGRSRGPSPNGQNDESSNSSGDDCEYSIFSTFFLPWPFGIIVRCPRTLY